MSFMATILVIGALWEKIRAVCRSKAKAVTEKAKRMIVMIKKGRWMGLRRVPPSSEKMSHRRHRRNEVNCTPVKSACKVVSMMATSRINSISSTISTSNLVTPIFILWPVNYQKQMVWKYNQWYWSWRASRWSWMIARNSTVLGSQLTRQSINSDGSATG